ncbi:YceI family protein [Fundidesulfovibrio terrae]|uniref:YceI family protein n=1 Tax=Fundidesulfovibrio terrae TaxID=2922866 RepID=UPI001FAF9DB6|nr:YceI family protein [Fundidesulfovibrio terrae]
MTRFPRFWSIAALVAVAGLAAWAPIAVAAGTDQAQPAQVQPAQAQPAQPAAPGSPSAAPAKPSGTTATHAGPAPAGAESKTVAPAPALSFDPPHCSVMFFVKHILAKVPGRFESYSGTVRFDPQNLEGSVIDVSVDMASISTGVPKRDEHLKSPDFFDVGKYPAMWFVSQKITSKGGSEYVAEGDLTIKDVTKRIQLPFTYLGTKPSPLEQGKQVVGFEARFSINLLEFHVGDGKFQRMGALGDTAEVVINLEMLR